MFNRRLPFAFRGHAANVGWVTSVFIALAVCALSAGLLLRARQRRRRDENPDAGAIDSIARSLAEAGGGAFGESSAAVEWIQTHISHVFLTADRAFKLRKSVRFDFLDFSTRELRNADCLREVELNRRLAPEFYLGIAPVEAAGESLRIGERIPHCTAARMDSSREHVVVMERLPEGRDAKTLIAGGEFGDAHLRSIVSVLAPFHDAHCVGGGRSMTAQNTAARIERVVFGNFISMQEARLGPRWRSLVDDVREATARAFGNLADAFEHRRTRRRFVDGHGDLHLEHIWFAAGSSKPIFVDCLEFNDSFRLIDRASEMAFLAMDLTYGGRRDLAERLLELYAVASDDFHLYSVVDFYAAYRASVRAKVSALAAGEEEIPHAQREAAAARALRYLELAADYLTEKGVAAVICMTGTVGSGKSTYARRIADRVGGLVISTDTTRRSMSKASDDAVDKTALYASERRHSIYEQILERASWPLRSGRIVILDATFETAALRALAADWARSLGAPVFLVRTRVSQATARERLAAREAAGSSDSDAGPSQLEASLARYEVPDEWPSAHRFTVDTDAPDAETGLDAIVAQVMARSDRQVRPN